MTSPPASRFKVECTLTILRKNLSLALAKTANAGRPAICVSRWTPLSVKSTTAPELNWYLPT